jgi:hypothetical protein
MVIAIQQAAVRDRAPKSPVAPVSGAAAVNRLIALIEEVSDEESGHDRGHEPGKR